MSYSPTTVAAYVRVSSKAQDYASQKAAIERAAAARGDRLGIWYAEKKSAKTLSRPELLRLRADARAGKLTRLYVFRLDRLARSGIRDTFEVVEELRSCGVELVSVSDGFALNGPAAEVVLAVMAWAAKMERLAINERIAAARERLASEGRPWGRPSRLTWQDSARISRFRDMGRTVREISVALKVPRSTVGRALRDNALPGGRTSWPRIPRALDGGNPGKGCRR
jgi:DNA invertase Pin-like site-specific DNA recombinase